ncbi:MAG: DUF2254 domain-containing protein [Nonlabens sp.]
MKILTRLRSFYNAITSSIAFYPTFIAVIAVIVSLLMKFAESWGISEYLTEHAPVLAINDVDTARNLLTTFIAGGISILVFSFSMVMLLLSQAAANYSPRVLPNLISERRHQIVLGIFYATILFNIFTILGIDPSGNNYKLPSFSILMGIIVTLLALTAFIYFIHSISSSIQINNIMRDIFSLSRKRLENLIEEQNDITGFEQTERWHSYPTKMNGTIQNLSTTALKKLMEKTDNQMQIVPLKGSYLRTNDILFKTKNEIPNKILDEIYKNFHLSNTELVSDNYILGLKQISEIGIKAMSPGVNDPGTAVDTINYLTDLFCLRMRKNNFNVLCDSENNPVLSLKSLSFENLIYHVLAPYRNYCKHDMSVMIKIMDMLLYLNRCEAIDDSFYAVIHKQAELCMADARSAIDNDEDLKQLDQIFKQIDQNS